MPMFKKIGKKLYFVIILIIININFVFMNVVGNSILPLKIKAVTYFGDEWPTTFWGREHLGDGERFERIKNDGFNTLIFCLPWREIQPDYYGDYNEVAIKKIDYIVDLAKEKGLNVMVRLGYTWDYYENESSNNRFRLMWRDESIKNAWYNYAGKMYEVLSVHDNFLGGFITWEDFWDGLIYTYSNYETVDAELIKLLINTQKRFYNLSMECRMHVDIVGDRVYSHEKTFSCGDASYSSLLLTNSMDQEYYKTVSAKDNIRVSESVIDKFSICNKPIFIDQFLYTESTPGYEFLSKVDDLNTYLMGMGKVFNEKTIGYGLWTYQDYVDNVIYNSEFALGKTNWDFIGDSYIVCESNNNSAFLGKGAEIKQDISWKGFLSKDNINFIMQVDAEEESDVQVSVFNQYKTYHLQKGIQNVTLNFDSKDYKELCIKSNGRIKVDNIKLFSHPH